MAVVSVFTIGYSMLHKKILKIAPPSIQKFNLEDTGNMVAIVATPEMMREYLIKQNPTGTDQNLKWLACDVDYRGA